MTNFKFSIAFLVAFTLFSVQNLEAQNKIFANFEGIDGGSKDFLHANWVDVLTFEIGSEQSGTTHMGGGAGAGKATFRDIVITKKMDKASVRLWEYLITGRHIRSAEFQILKGNNILTVIKIENLIIKDISNSATNGGGSIEEIVEINYGKIHISHTPRDPSTGRQTGAPVVYGWDVARHMSWSGR